MNIQCSSPRAKVSCYYNNMLGKSNLNMLGNYRRQKIVDEKIKQFKEENKLMTRNSGLMIQTDASSLTSLRFHKKTITDSDLHRYKSNHFISLPKDLNNFMSLSSKFTPA